MYEFPNGKINFPGFLSWRKNKLDISWQNFGGSEKKKKEQAMDNSE